MSIERLEEVIKIIQGLGILEHTNPPSPDMKSLFTSIDLADNISRIAQKIPTTTDSKELESMRIEMLSISQKMIVMTPDKVINEDFDDIVKSMQAIINGTVDYFLDALGEK